MTTVEWQTVARATIAKLKFSLHKQSENHLGATKQDVLSALYCTFCRFMENLVKNLVCQKNQKHKL